MKQLKVKKIIIQALSFCCCRFEGKSSCLLTRNSAVSLKDMQRELELLTKELRQVNLQQFIKQTGAKVTVLPAEPGEEESSSSSSSNGQRKGNFSFVLITSEWMK